MQKRNFGIARLVLVVLATCLMRAAAQDTTICVVGHGWHTGLIVPMADVDLSTTPGLRGFQGWDAVEIGWGDEGFYRGASAISLGVALKAVATPTPTVFHIVGVNFPVEDDFPESEVVSINLDADQMKALNTFIRETFELKDGMPIDLGEGIYGYSRFFRSKGSYYFPNTCNVWTLKAVKAAGLPVFPAAGIRAENVISQSAKHGTVIRRYPGRSRVTVLCAALVAAGLGWALRKRKRLTLLAWGILIVAIVTLAGLSMATVNGILVPAWLNSAAVSSCWFAAAFIAMAHALALRTRFR